MTLEILTPAMLLVSPLNVRTNAEDADATAALESSILQHGLLENLVAHPMDDGRFGVVAGGRRLRAIHKLVTSGALPPDFAIPVKVRDLTSAELIELSTTENLMRRDLRPYEVHAAIAAAHAAGSRIDAIAANLGQTETWVRRMRRLGELLPPIREAYIAGDIDIEQASAYAATADEDLQAAAWEHFRNQPRYMAQAHHIRAWLKIGNRDHERLLALVGDVVYRAAGGRFELDLFADGPERGRIADEALLRRLAEEILSVERDAIRVATGLGRDLRFVDAPPQLPNGGTDYALAVEPKVNKNGDIKLPPGEIVAQLVVDEDGQIETNYWWASRKAQKAAGAKPAGALTLGESNAIESRGIYGQQARQKAKDDHGLTADGIEIVRSLRRQLLRAVLVDDLRTAVNDPTYVPDSLASDYLLFAQARMLLGKDKPAQTGMRAIASEWGSDHEPSDIVAPHLDCWGGIVWNEALELVMAMRFMREPDLGAAFSAFRLEGPGTKELVAALVAGSALIRSAAIEGWRVPLHDRIAAEADADDQQLRRYWTPDSAFVGLFPKLTQLGFAQPYVAEESFRHWHKSPANIVTGAVVGVLNGTGNESTEALHWVHPALSFVAHATDTSPVVAQKSDTVKDKQPEPAL